MPLTTPIPASGGLDQALWYGPREMRYITESVSVVNTDTAVSLKKTIPANSRIIAFNMNFATAVGLATAVKVGLGISGDPDSIGLSGTTVTKNTKTDGLTLTTGFVTSETTPIVACCATNGSAAGTFNASATIWVRIYYETFPSFPDAA